MSMTIDLAACEWLKLNIVTEPATTPTDWAASIDNGDTWVVAQDVGDSSGWLVAGPDYEGGSTPNFEVDKGQTKVKVRLIDDPETVIRYATRITAKNF